MRSLWPNVVTSLRLLLLLAAVFAPNISHWTLAVAALAFLCLDGLDGWLARKLEAATHFGARLDAEVDALAVLLLSGRLVLVDGYPSWVLALGLLRYVYVFYAALFSLLVRSEQTRRRSARWIFAFVVVALAVAPLFNRAAALGALTLALVLLTISFTPDFWQPWARLNERVPAPWRWVMPLTLLCLIMRLPAVVGEGAWPLSVEVGVIAAVAVMLRGQARRRVALAAYVVWPLLWLFAAYELGVFWVLNRRAAWVTDGSLMGSGLTYLAGTIDALMISWVVAGVIAAIFAAVLMAGLWRAATRELRWISGRAQTTVAAALMAVALVSAPLGGSEVQRVAENVRRSLNITEQVAHAEAGGMTRLRDEIGALSLRVRPTVWFIIMESYGAVLLDDPDIRSHYEALMPMVQRDLDAAGFEVWTGLSRSPVWGGASWLADATLLSGLTVDNQLLYNYIIHHKRSIYSLVDFFRDRGYRALELAPGTNNLDGPAGNLFGYEAVYGRQGLDFPGGRRGWTDVPDQFLFGKARAVTEADGASPHLVVLKTICTHRPWYPQPLVAHWQDVAASDAVEVPPLYPRISQAHPDEFAKVFFNTVSYSWEALTRFIAEAPEDHVFFVVGDHQPHFGKPGTKASPGFEQSADFGTLAHMIVPKGLAKTGPASFSPGPLPTSRDLEISHDRVAELVAEFLASLEPPAPQPASEVERLARDRPSSLPPSRAMP